MKKQHIIFSTLIAVMVVFAAVIPAMADPEEPAAATTSDTVTSELSITVPSYFDIQENTTNTVKTLSGADKVSVDADAVTLKNAINVQFDVTTNSTETVRVTVATDANGANNAANGTNVAFALDGAATTAGVAVASATSNAIGTPVAASNPGVIAFPHTLQYTKNGGAAANATFSSGHWDIEFDPGVGTIVFNIPANSTTVANTYSTQDPSGTYKAYLTATRVVAQQASNDP